MNISEEVFRAIVEREENEGWAEEEESSDQPEMDPFREPGVLPIPDALRDLDTTRQAQEADPACGEQTSPRLNVADRRQELRHVRDEARREVASLGFYDKLALYLESQRAHYGQEYIINVRNRESGLVEQALNMPLDGRALESTLDQMENVYIEGYIYTSAGLVRDVVTPRSWHTILREAEGMRFAMEEKTLDAYLIGLRMYGRKEVELNIAGELKRRGWDGPLSYWS